LDTRSYLLVAGMSILPFVVHEIFKVLVFKRLKYNVYDLFKYEYRDESKDAPSSSDGK